MALANNKGNMKKNKGFSLLELLVVISIIGILISLGVASFSTAQKKSRDARRKADIKAMQDGFEQYYAVNNGSYGATCAAMFSDLDIFPAGAPVDPKGGAYSYTCLSTATANAYCVCAYLEGGEGSGNSNSAASIIPCSYGGDEDFHCRGNLQ